MTVTQASILTSNKKYWVSNIMKKRIKELLYSDETTKLFAADSVPSEDYNELLVVPIEARVVCESCGWEEKSEDCEVGVESDGWEYPEYEVLLCPSCGEGSVVV